MDEATNLSQSGSFTALRLAELHRHLTHLRILRPRVTDSEALRRNLSFQNDVLFSLLAVCQSVLNIAGDLSTRRGLRFESYEEAVGNLDALSEFPYVLVKQMESLPGLRNSLVHEYLSRDLDGVIEALDRLQPVEEFAEIVRQIEVSQSQGA